MKKLKVGLIFGGKSGEHEVSVVSAMSIFNALDKQKYDVTMIGIDPAGRWLLPDQTKLLAQRENPRLINLNKEKNTVGLLPYASEKQLIPVEAKSLEVNHFDVIFPVLHGTYGEDGTIQGLLELAQIPYVGCGVLGSSLCMDKEVSRRLLAAGGIPVVSSLLVTADEIQNDIDAVIARVENKFGYPYFVKPVNMGSSVGIHKVKSRDMAAENLRDAARYDLKVLVEQAVAARELECSVLGNENPKASIIGEIVPKHEFYSYEAKYMDENGAELLIPAKDLKPDVTERIQKMAIQAFKLLDCRGMARVDFFMDRNSGELYLNELNTIPGFTKISMYPKLWEASGLPYAQLLDELIELALDYHARKSRLKTTYEPKS